MAGHLQTTREWVDRITDIRVEWVDYTSGHASYNPPLGPRVWLYCPQPMAEAWSLYMQRIEAMANEDMDTRQPPLPPFYNVTAKRFKDVRASVDEVWAMVRSAAEEIG
jgi:hypothetical protein